MSRGPEWNEDEIRICEYMWKSGKADIEIAAVLTRRKDKSVKSFRISKGWVKAKPVVTHVVGQLIKVATIAGEHVVPKRADSLPDIGEQVSKLIEKQTLMEATLWAINCKLGELIELQKTANSMSKDALELWRAADARGRASKGT
jgi:hypothetical protein